MYHVYLILADKKRMRRVKLKEWEDIEEDNNM